MIGVRRGPCSGASSSRWLAASLLYLVLAARPLEAQQPLAGQNPPQVLQLVIERIKPGNEARYDAIEQQLAVLCKERCPNAYLALESFATPKEIYWLTAYRTADDVDRIAAVYASDALLRADLGRCRHRRMRSSSPS